MPSWYEYEQEANYAEEESLKEEIRQLLLDFCRDKRIKLESEKAEKIVSMLMDGVSND